MLSRRLRIYLFYCLSGFLSLGYQVAWFRIYVDRLGASSLTFAIVLCAFIAGLGAGSLASQRIAKYLSKKLRFTDLLRLYGLLELIVGLLVLVGYAATWIPHAAEGTFPYVLEDAYYVQAAWRRALVLSLAGASVFLPCFFMGVTFPLLCDIHSGVERFPSSLYAWNTLGACSGVLVCQFLLLPGLGHFRMLAGLAIANIALGLYFLFSGGAHTPAMTEQEADDAGETSPPVRAVRSGLLLTCAALSGLLAGALEGDMSKRVSFFEGNSSAGMSMVSFWAILGIFLGSWLVRSVRSLNLKHIKAAYVLGFLMYWLVWRYAYIIQGKLIEYAGNDVTGISETARQALAQRIHYFPTNNLQLLAITGVIVFPAYLLISLLLPYLCNRIHGDRRHLGLAYGVNTISFCLGVVAFTWLAPRVNVFYSMKLMMALFLLAVMFLLMLSEQRRTPVWLIPSAVILVLVACFAVPDAFERTYVDPTTGAAEYPVRAIKSNGVHTTYIVSSPEAETLYFDNHPMSGTSPSARRYMRLMAHFPLLAHERPEQALLICYGVGNTASAIAAHDTIKQIDVAELNHKVIETAPEFGHVTNNVHLDPRIRFVNDDGRNFLRLTDRKYDLVTSEPPPPMRPGVYRLYSREYYDRVRSRLRPGGTMTQWLPSYQMPAEAVERVIATFVQAFPQCMLICGSGEEFILVGSDRPLNLLSIKANYDARKRVASDLARLSIGSSTALVSRIVMADATLRRLYGDKTAISDERNDLAHLYVDPQRPAEIRYAPNELKKDLEAAGIQSWPQLASIVTHPGRLHFRVPDFPIIVFANAEARQQRGGVPTGADWYRLVGLVGEYNVALAAGRVSEAISRLQTARKLAAEHPGILLGLADLLAQEEQYAAAADALASFRSVEPADIEGTWRQILVLTFEGRIREAAAAAETALEQAPSNAFVQSSYGTLLESQGRSKEAIACYERALKSDPHCVEALRGKAWLQATHASLSPGKASEALSLARKACALAGRPTSLQLATVAAAYAKAGNYDEARKTIMKAIELARSRGRTSAVKAFEQYLAGFEKKQPVRVSHGSAN